MHAEKTHRSGLPVPLSPGQSLVLPLQAPALPERKLRRILPGLLEAQLPFPLADCVYSFALLPSGPVALVAKKADLAGQPRSASFLPLAFALYHAGLDGTRERTFAAAAPTAEGRLLFVAARDGRFLSAMEIPEAAKEATVRMTFGADAASVPVLSPNPEEAVARAASRLPGALLRPGADGRSAARGALVCGTVLLLLCAAGLHTLSSRLSDAYRDDPGRIADRVSPWVKSVKRTTKPVSVRPETMERILEDAKTRKPVPELGMLSEPVLAERLETLLSRAKSHGISVSHVDLSFSGATFTGEATSKTALDAFLKDLPGALPDYAFEVVSAPLPSAPGALRFTASSKK